MNEAEHTEAHRLQDELRAMEKKLFLSGAPAPKGDSMDGAACDNRISRNADMNEAFAALRGSVDRADGFLKDIMGDSPPAAIDKLAEPSPIPSVAEILSGGPTIVRDQAKRLDAILATLREQLL